MHSVDKSFVLACVRVDMSNSPTGINDFHESLLMFIDISHKWTSYVNSATS